MRRSIRYTLLAGTLGACIVTGVAVDGFTVLPPLLALLFAFWFPQLVFLEIGSAYRSGLIGSLYWGCRPENIAGEDGG
ncbi:hypothetical protein [Rubripirellula reticaptiva]|nr:hypothetical protein [Rubripirellula reticaptiva]